MNLINNAIQSIDDEGTIHIRTRTIPDNKVLVEIADTGMGISKEIKNRVFEPFFTTKGVGEGTGLGLSLSFSIIQQHGGEISFTDNEPHGTIFSLILPVEGPLE